MIGKEEGNGDTHSKEKGSTAVHKYSRVFMKATRIGIYNTVEDFLEKVFRFYDSVFRVFRNTSSK